MMKADIQVYISYGQLAIFDSALQSPFNDWQPRHVSQGFAWRRGSVSFRTLIESGDCNIAIYVADHFSQISDNAMRVIEVPFDIKKGMATEIGGISDSKIIAIPNGLYALRCELMGGEGKEVRLSFSRQDEPRFAIIQADDEIDMNGDILTTAFPAGC